MSAPLFKRVVVKLSGEALMGGGQHGLDAGVLERVAADLKATAALGAEVAVVVGGGNFFRGVGGVGRGIERVRGDTIGMLATVMNAIAIEAALEGAGQAARALTAIPMPVHVETYSRAVAANHLKQGRVVVLGGGTGSPFFTTDTTAALRAAELGAGAIMKATQVDGIYSADPKKDPKATRYDRLTHDEAIARSLGVMDTAAFALARENKIPIMVFKLGADYAIRDALSGKGKATLVTPQ